MARLLNVMAFLIDNGRIKSGFDFWNHLMTAVLDDILKNHPKSGVEFLVLEICTALYIMKPHTKYYESFIGKLKEINPYDKYVKYIQLLHVWDMR